MEGDGWECVQQNTGVLQVGQPHCIVGQMYGYKNTFGYGGEYHYYKGSETTNTEWRYGNEMSGNKIRLMEQGGANMLVRTDSKWYGKNKHSIQSDGGKVKLNFDGGPFWSAGSEMDKYCAKVEWWKSSSTKRK